MKWRWTDSWKRFAMHLGVGGFGAWLTFHNAPLGLGFWLGFLAYEYLQEWRRADWSFKDVIGALVMFGIVAGVLAL